MKPRLLIQSDTDSGIRLCVYFFKRLFVRCVSALWATLSLHLPFTLTEEECVLSVCGWLRRGGTTAKTFCISYILTWIETIQRKQQPGWLETVLRKTFLDFCVPIWNVKPEFWWRDDEESGGVALRPLSGTWVFPPCVGEMFGCFCFSSRDVNKERVCPFKRSLVGCD